MFFFIIIHMYVIFASSLSFIYFSIAMVPKDLCCEYNKCKIQDIFA